MRYLITALIFVSPIALGAPTNPGTYDPVAFKKRFEKADVNKNGKLTREEAYAAFPRMPEFFDEIDANRDGSITLKEVQNAMNKRVNAAMDNSKTGKRYAIPADNTSTTETKTGEQRYFSSRQAAQRHYRLEYYESIATRQPAPNIPAHAVDGLRAPAQVDKKF